MKKKKKKLPRQLRASKASVPSLILALCIIFGHLLFRWWWPTSIGIATLFEESKAQIYWFDTRGAKGYL
jgi:hypothetical protein